MMLVASQVGRGRAMTEKPPDVLVENRRGLYLLRPVTPAGHAWLEEHEGAEPWPWVDGPPAVSEQQKGQAIVMALLDAGLRVGDALRSTHWTAHGDRVH
jgi:hypothetical protein